MKHLMFVIIALILIAGSAFGQSNATYQGNFVFDEAQPISFSHQQTTSGYFNNFTASSDDSTAYLTASIGSIGTKIGLCRSVYLILVATDSVAADLTVRMRNGTLTSQTTTYTDSLVGTSNTNNLKVITLKDATTNRLTIYDEFKVIADFRASGNGTTSGRTVKSYLWWVR